jgi:hypothetical protein
VKKLPFDDVRRATSGNRYCHRRVEVPAKTFDLTNLPPYTLQAAARATASTWDGGVALRYSVRDRIGDD